jgi:dsRNA-specific ribonuclease
MPILQGLWAIIEIRKYMNIDNLSIKLDEAKQVIAIPEFKSDNLLKIALVALSTLQLPAVSDQKRQIIERQHRRLAFLGDRILDAVLADYLFATYPDLTTKDLDDWRQEVTCRESLGKFAIKLGLPSVCSSWHRKDRKSPEEEPGVYGEMFEALVAVIYLDGDRNFEKVYGWLRDRFIQKAVESYKDDDD